MYVGLHVKYPLFLSDFNETLIFSAEFRNVDKQNFINLPVGAELLHAVGRTERRT
jgi:hypothetical protein